MPRMGGYVPADHKARHQTGGRDEVSIASLLGIPAELAIHAIDIDAHHYPPMISVAVGNYYWPLGWGGGTAASKSANIYNYLPIWLPVPMTFDRIGINVTVAASSGKSAILGCYKHTANQIGNLQFDAGEVAIDSVALQLASINQQLTAGYWWLLVNLEEACTVDTVSSGLHFPWLPTPTNSTFKGFLDSVTYPSPAVLPDTPLVAAGDISTTTPICIYLRVKSIP